ncbi:hypothetical protein L198_01967 [Cryptococcus wingfieldii CBS 7118]|uniref:Right handed beta helix domain-containing protein n=1 Tax=Cryptococcus wingfieldii CBS 7118 TaxID=1295528 RepID=A0A1E3JWP5_9TREE|nr:hypothetical protein L198_01967 [Cryptococcus wingfieldii CBS 7118]ODO05275.1 hypothetical protein L198_01967 [Cryptococcus wingfieldii CBS 7118]
MLLSSLALLFLPLISAAAPRSSDCLLSGTERAINEIFATGGEGATVTLCPGSVHRLNASVQFTAPSQTITTLGNPKDRERAMLLVDGPDLAVAIHADCQRCSFAMIRSIIIDGNRPQLLRIPKGEALVEIGNAESQTVKDCKLYEPRGWSTLHFREGDSKQCRFGHIVDNEIGPCGEEWDDDYDGMDEVNPPWGNPRADGISLACKDSIVERNVVYDATDGAIVIFGSANSVVKNNHIYSRTRVILGGINLVDYEPWEGDYTGVTVHNNHLHALGRYFKVGIVIGPASWSDDTESVVRGAVVTNNRFYGQYWGYGLVVASAKDFEVMGNKVINGNEGEAKFSGVPGSRCPKAPENGKPTAFLINRGSAKGTFQDDFVNGEVQHIICLNPDEKYKPWRFRDSPEALAANIANNPLANAAIDSRIAEALVSYQMSLLSSMSGINQKIERLTTPIDPLDAQPVHEHERATLAAEVEKQRREKEKSSGNKDVDELIRKLEELEKGGRKMKKTLDGVKVDFEGLAGRLRKNADEHKPIIEQIFLHAQTLLLGSTPLSTSQQKLFRSGRGMSMGIRGEGYTPLGVLGGLLGAGAIGLAARGLIKRWRSENKGNKLY